MATQVTISYTSPQPPDGLLLVGSADGAVLMLTVPRAEYNAQPNIGAKRQYVAGKLAELLATQRVNTEPGLPGVIVVP